MFYQQLGFFQTIATIHKPPCSLGQQHCSNWNSTSSLKAEGKRAQSRVLLRFTNAPKPEVEQPRLRRRARHLAYRRRGGARRVRGRERGAPESSPTTRAFPGQLLGTTATWNHCYAAEALADLANHQVTRTSHRTHVYASVGHESRAEAWKMRF